jgi:CBS domain containing-hemolysin-like protein
LPFYVWFALGIAAAGATLFFALAHSALRLFSRARLEDLLRRRKRLEDLARLYRHHEDLIQMARALHIVSLVALALLAMLWATDRFGSAVLGWTVGTALAALVGVAVGGVVPMAWAKYAAESVLMVTLPACQACRVAFSPVQRVLRLLDRLVGRMAGAQVEGHAASHIEEEIRSVLSEGEREGVLEEDQKDMIESVLRFRKADASQIMTPRTDIVHIDVGASAEEARALVAQSHHSRIPVTRGNIDTVVGVLYAKDLLDRACGVGAEEHLQVKDVMRPPLFVPETKKLHELLREFQGDQVHMAIVLDEYGGTSGLVTIEDVVEEIVGEIVDEYEQAPPRAVRRLGERSYEVEARVRIGDLNGELGLALPEGADYETLGGFVLARLGYIPKAGEALAQDNLKITVVEADERRIARVRLDLTASEQKTSND